MIINKPNWAHVFQRHSKLGGTKSLGILSVNSVSLPNTNEEVALQW